MFGSVLLGVAIGQTAPPQITLKDTAFILKEGAASATVSLIPPPRTLNTQAGRWWLEIGNRVFTFDENGVGIRQGKFRSYSRLTAIATTGKLFSQEQIDHINRDAADGNRTLEVSALSGYEVIGNTLYLLVRWENKEKNPWLEAIVKFDLTAKTPSAQLVGRFEGFSTAKGRVDDRLGSFKDALVALTQKPDGLGLAKWDHSSNQASYVPLGSRVMDAKVLDKGGYGMTIVRGKQGAWQIGLVNIVAGDHRPVYEFRGQIVGTEEPYFLRVAKESGHQVINLDSGAEMPIARAATYKHTEFGVIVWTPQAAPKSAQLYSTEAFRFKASWAPPAQTPTKAPPAATL